MWTNEDKKNPKTIVKQCFRILAVTPEGFEPSTVRAEI